MQLSLALKPLRSGLSERGHQSIQWNRTRVYDGFSIVAATESDAPVGVNRGLRDAGVEIEVSGMMGDIEIRL